MTTRCAPSVLRSKPLVDWSHGFRSPKTLAAIEHLAAGRSRLETARLVGLDKANVRVIELRAKRRGLLPGSLATQAPAPRALRADLRGLIGLSRGRGRPGTPDHVVARLRLAVAADPSATNTAIAIRIEMPVHSVAYHRRKLGLPTAPRGGFQERKRRDDYDDIVAAIHRGDRHTEIAARYGLTRQRIHQYAKRVGASPGRRS